MYYVSMIFGSRRHPLESNPGRNPTALRHNRASFQEEGSLLYSCKRAQSLPICTCEEAAVLSSVIAREASDDRSSLTTMFATAR
jgi:hypothetical protein